MLAEEILHLLVLDDSSNNAETVANMLRNAGHAVHADRIEDDEDLREALAKDDCDMVLAKPRIPYLSAVEAIDIIRHAKQSVPLLVIGDDADGEQIDEILKAGARDVVYLSRPMRLAHALLREVIAAREHRKLLQCESSLDEANNRAQNLVDSSRDAITYVHDGMHIYANESYLKTFGYSDPEEIAGLPILNMVKKEEHAKFKKFLRDFDKGKAESNTIDVDGLRPDGSDFNITMEFTPAAFDGEPCTQILIRAQAHNKELEQKLSDMSKLDLLTGAYNRQYFLDAFNRVTGKTGHEGVIFYLHPDNFKQTREDIGIGPSDQLLADFAKLIAGELNGKGGFIARFEGEYFTLLLDDQSLGQARGLAEQLCKTVEEHPFKPDGSNISVTCSIGLALYNEATTNPQDVLSRAERALSEADKMGGNHYRAYIPGEEEMAEQERIITLARHVKMALQGNKLELQFQPIVSLKGDENENYEVFVRMRDEEDLILGPNEFFPAAEKAGLMTAVDRWVIAHSIKAVTEQRREGKPAVLFVNLSAASLKDEKLLPWLRDILKAAHTQPDTLVIEISESVACSNLRSFKMLFEGLSQLHVRLAIDHFGIAPNYANLIKHSGADFLKLDASIVNALSSSQEAQDKVKEISVLAAENQKKVVANSVEDPHTLATIYSTGVDYIQGYFLQEPNPEMNYDFSSMG
ncbi:MAG: EAL domain-containing protein [Gammaproteobacteria bacterium]|nr:EAL domain-containing protein [Gammaproteobacteria bacterium]MCW8841357.1 EAL domain-containing protein [Gammaproteobacteria bacterium]MCW8959866.1 EAL domain-containing protein [Gammaproteobacteria bacterium]MCW8973438.1 EAL domain-containing protein [Gammaproteobacteria bacterium]MCW8991642.1 EAL domain-containing protein [Gammaproteobacteria bacterium]